MIVTTDTEHGVEVTIGRPLCGVSYDSILRSGDCAYRTAGIGYGTDLDGSVFLMLKSLHKSPVEGTELEIVSRPEPDTYMALCDETSGSVFVKEVEFFRVQRGFREPWGERWLPIFAKSVEHAREKACAKKYAPCQGCSIFQ